MSTLLRLLMVVCFIDNSVLYRLRDQLLDGCLSIVNTVNFGAVDGAVDGATVDRFNRHVS